ncbi:MAG TPA: GlsB/YeaQ/YmgE family stress response membrane protein [Candidatus Dormibacteraeota bacterium]|nr:GlsB/YeaQ/YmgE family stress response membrane protein [Candidatus Dormibacteraeota bacterium]
MATAHGLRPDKGVTIQLPSNITIGDQQTLLLVGLGLIAGLVAGRVVGHSPGVVIQMIIGVLGAFLGRWLLSRARDQLGIDTGGGIISLVFAAFLGALVLMVVARAFGGGFRRGSS